jgi:hypothetical protein
MNKIKGILSQYRISSKLLILIGITCFCGVLGIIIWTVFSHGNATDIGSLKWLQLIQSFCMFIIPSMIIAYLLSKKPLNFLYLDRKTKKIDLLYIVLFMVIAIPFINLLGNINQQLVLPKAFAGLESWMKTAEEEASQLTERFLDVHNLHGLFSNIFLIALVPALGEELFFRGTLQGILKDWKGVRMAIWITAIIFSAIHFEFYGFVPRMLLGAFFGYLLFWSENLWLPFTAHFINNVIAILFFYFKNNGYKLPDIDSVGTGNTLWLGIVSGLLVIFGFFVFQRSFGKRINL